MTAPKGTSVHAMCAGVVIDVDDHPILGNYVTIKHNHSNFTSTYGHLKKAYVKEGRTVRRGQRVGAVGTTGRTSGPHVHVDVKEHGKATPFMKKYFNHELPSYDLDYNKTVLAKRSYKKR